MSVVDFVSRGRRDGHVDITKQTLRNPVEDNNGGPYLEREKARN